MTPVFAWGILGPDSSVKPMCIFLKVNKECGFLFYLKTLFI
jgi:hypothetical protein